MPKFVYLSTWSSFYFNFFSIFILTVWMACVNNNHRLHTHARSEHRHQREKDDFETKNKRKKMLCIWCFRLVEDFARCFFLSFPLSLFARVRVLCQFQKVQCLYNHAHAHAHTHFDVSVSVSYSLGSSFGAFLLFLFLPYFKNLICICVLFTFIACSLFRITKLPRKEIFCVSPPHHLRRVVAFDFSN